MNYLNQISIRAIEWASMARIHAEQSCIVLIVLAELWLVLKTGGAAL